LIHGRFSFQDEAAGSSPARPTNRPVSSGNPGHRVLQVQSNRVDPVWEEVLGAPLPLSRNNASEQPLCRPGVVGLLQIVGCTACQNPSLAELGPHFHSGRLGDAQLGVILAMERSPQPTLGAFRSPDSAVGRCCTSSLGSGAAAPYGGTARPSRHGCCWPVDRHWRVDRTQR
jgi:hypothetical protein